MFAYYNLKSVLKDLPQIVSAQHNDAGIRKKRKISIDNSVLAYYNNNTFRGYVIG